MKLYHSNGIKFYHSSTGILTPIYPEPPPSSWGIINIIKKAIPIIIFIATIIGAIRTIIDFIMILIN